jgi:putative endonuclease
MTPVSPTGARAEQQALAFLQTQGLKAVSRNFGCRFGEIDLIMDDGECLVFVEVRYRRSVGFASPAETVTPAKRRRIQATASYYLQTHPTASRRPCRFDLIAICPARQPPLEWIKDAFSVDD